MNDLNKLRQQLRTEYNKEFVVFLEWFGDIKAYVYSYYADAKKHYNRISNSIIGDDVNNKFWIEQL